MCKQHPPEAIVLTEPQFGRYPGVPCETLEAVLRGKGLEVSASYQQPDDAVAWIETRQTNSTTDHSVLCIGSLYLQGNVLVALGADDDQTLAVVTKD